MATMLTIYTAGATSVSDVTAPFTSTPFSYSALPVGHFTSAAGVNVTDINQNITDSFNVTNTTVMINATDKETLPQERSWVYIYPGPIICLFGMVCNVLNLCVLSQKELSDSPYTYLTALASADLGMLTLSFIHLVTSNVPLTFVKAFYDAYIFFAVGNIFFNCSVWFMVLLTIERMLFVTRPMTMRSSRKKARIRILIVAVCCSLLNVPRFLCYEISYYHGQYYPKGTPFRKSETNYSFAWAQAILINFIPLIILIITNSALIRAVHRARQQRKQMRMSCNKEASLQRDQARLTKTLIAIVILFFVCTIPSAFVEDPIAYTVLSGEKTWREYLQSSGNQTFIYISNLLLFVNSASNFSLYCAFNERFRKAMCSFFRQLVVRRRSLRLYSPSQTSTGSGTKTTCTSI